MESAKVGRNVQSLEKPSSCRVEQSRAVQSGEKEYYTFPAHTEMRRAEQSRGEEITTVGQPGRGAEHAPPEEGEGGHLCSRAPPPGCCRGATPRGDARAPVSPTLAPPPLPRTSTLRPHPDLPCQGRPVCLLGTRARTRCATVLPPPLGGMPRPL